MTHCTVLFKNNMETKSYPLNQDEIEKSGFLSKALQFNHDFTKDDSNEIDMSDVLTLGECDIYIASLRQDFDLNLLESPLELMNLSCSLHKIATSPLFIATLSNNEALVRFLIRNNVDIHNGE